MPTMADLGKLATELYKGNPTVGAKQNVSGLQLDTSKASSLGSGNWSSYVWSGEASSRYSAYGRYFYQSHTGWYGNDRSFSGYQAVCVGE